MLTAASLQTLFTISPADLPNKSAAAMRFSLSPTALVGLSLLSDHFRFPDVTLNF